jgi:putative ABC transport system permease protein
MNSLWKDTRYAMRTLIKRPGFALMALLTLALGIGANTAIFSIVNGVLLRPLPFSEPDRLVWVWGRILNAGQRASVSPPDYLDYRSLNKSFEHFAASMNVPFNLTSSDEPERLLAAGVSGNYFQAFGVNAALGRTFSVDNEQSGADQVAVLSDGLWKRRFGADPSIVNKTIALDGKSYQVLGVMPPSFRFPQSAERWVPVNFGASPDMKIRKAHFLRPVGRLREGVSLAQAQSEMDGIALSLAEQYPDSNTGWSLGLVSLRDQINGGVRPTLLVLLGVVAFVLLIACANVANLLLVRAASRHKEMALRAALGASRWRLLRQMLIESLLLSLLGGVLGALIAVWGVDLLVAFSDSYLPSTTQVSIDARVLGFTLALSLLAGVVFGVVPALQASRINFNQIFK